MSPEDKLTEDKFTGNQFCWKIKTISEKENSSGKTQHMKIDLTG